MSITFTSTTYRMNRAGQFVKCEDRPALSAGTIVWSFGFAGQMDRWAVIEDGGDRVVKLSENSRSDYFADPYHTLDRYTEPIEEKFGIGFYYDLNAERATAEEIAEAIQRANDFIVQRDAEIAAEKAEAARVWEEETAAARAAYGSYLNDLGGVKYPGAADVAKNIRLVLKKFFPGQKFSVRKTSYDCIHVEWTDGPTDAQVENVAGCFEKVATRDPYNDDLWDYHTSAFNALYGGVQWLRFEREYTPERWDAMTAEIEAICPDTKGRGFYGDLFSHDGGRELYDKYLTDLDSFHAWTWIDSSIVAHVILGHRSFYEAPAPKVEKATEAREASNEPQELPNGLEIVDYSEKAIAVTGDTRRVADTLKELGGRFNARLSCGPGWIFSKRQEAKVREALAL